MTPSRFYVTTTIPYVNARPHLGFALELVQADVLARHHRQRGDEVRFLTGTDDNSLKNVLAAEAAGLPTRELVDRNAAAFQYQDQLHGLISSGRLRIEPAACRNEVLGLIAAGLEDFSISRSHTRARGWGIPVPNDPDQVIYVRWDALGNYISALDYGRGGQDYQHWWVRNNRRVHLLGKGVLRFHAVYWPAMLLSASEPLPTDILVHDYLTVDGNKISKSTGKAIDPVTVANQ
jgi:methionyl-tRNA synthetase